MTGEGRGCVTEDMIMWIKTNGLAQPMNLVKMKVKTRMSSDLLNLKLPVVHTEIRRNFFSARVINMWNDIPYEIKSAGTLNIFKNKLDNWLNS